MEKPANPKRCRSVHDDTKIGPIEVDRVSDAELRIRRLEFGIFLTHFGEIRSKMAQIWPVNHFFTQIAAMSAHRKGNYPSWAH